MANKVAKKTVKKSKTASKTAKKPNSNSAKTQEVSVDYKDLFYGTISAIAVYVFALWAIDSGSLWVYGLMFASLYYTVHFYRLFIRNKFFNNDKTSKAKSTKS